MQSLVLDITDYVILYGTYFILLIHIYLLISNFAGHFKFHHRCPCIRKDEEIGGIYPTLLIFYILISLLISSFIVYITWDDAYNSAHSTFNYSQCYIQFEIYSTNIFQPNFIDNVHNIIILLTISILFLLETYFSYNRYYGCMMVASSFHTPSKLRIFLPYTIYIILLLLIVWLIVSIIPILILFVCIFHFLINTYFSYCFYVSVKFSYMQVFKLQKECKYLGGAYYQMQKQIKQIRLIYILATLSALISGFINLSFTLCQNTVRLIPFGLFCNILLLFLMFNRNRTLLSNTLLCKCSKVYYSLFKHPCTIIKKRRDSVWAQQQPSTLMKIKTTSANSLKVLRGLPQKMTPNFIKVRTNSNANALKNNDDAKTGEEAPPNTPIASHTEPHMQQTSELNLDIIEEDIPNKFSLDRSAGNDNTNSHDFGNDDLTHSTGTIMMERLPSSKRVSNTITATQSYLNSDDMMNNIIYGNKSKSTTTTTTQTHSSTITNNNINIGGLIPLKRNYLKPYNSITKSTTQTQTTTTTEKTLSQPQRIETPQQSLDLDTIPAEDEIIQFQSDERVNSIGSIGSIIKKYRTRQDSTTIGHNMIYNDATHIKYDTENIDNNIDDELMLEHALTFGRMENVRATMRQDHINEIKMELGSLKINDDIINEAFEDDEKYINSENENDRHQNEDDKRSSLQKQVEQIELTKEELEREKKILQLKKTKNNKRIAFGADMALEIVQESIQKQEEKRKIAQHEFYVHELFSVKSHKIFKSPTAHHVNQISDIIDNCNAPKHTPIHSLHDIIQPQNSPMMIGNTGSLNSNDKSDMSMIDLKQPSDHLRSRSDNQMIKDIANQIVMHTKNHGEKEPSERSKNNKLKPKPKLNMYSASEDQETVTPQNKMKSKKKVVMFDSKQIIDKNHLSPIQIEQKQNRHPKYEPSNDDVFDIYDNIRGIQRSPSPPPSKNILFDHDSKGTDKSIFQSFRSWMFPNNQSSIRANDSDRANNLHNFLKSQGLTMHVNIMEQINETEVENNDNHIILHETDNQKDTENENENNETPIGHGVFNINVNEIDIKYLSDLTISNNNNNQQPSEPSDNHLNSPIPMGHMIMNLDLTQSDHSNNSASDLKHIRNTSTAL